MRSRLHPLRAVTIVAALMAIAAPGWAQIGRIGGTVVDDQHNPIKGATVTAENPNASPASFNASTDDKGRFSMLGLRAGEWTVTASAPGFQSSQGKVTIATIGSPNAPVMFTLIKEIGRAHV